MIIDSPQFTLPAVVQMHARARPDATAFVDGTRSLTWRQFSDAVDAEARELVGAGLTPDTAVCALLDSSVTSWVQAFAVLRAGGVLSPLNPMSTPAGLAAMITDSESRLMIVSDKYRQLADDAVELTPPDLRPVQFDPHDRSSSSRLPEVAPQDRFNIIYSSGTTGRPKGIVHTHEARLNSAITLGIAFRATSGTRLLLLTPPHTNGSWMVTLPVVHVGGTVIVADGFTVPDFVGLVNTRRPTLTFVVPTIVQRLLESDQSSQIDWESFDFILTAGAPMPGSMKQAFSTVTGNRLGELWGLTEGVATVIYPEELLRHPESAGRALVQTELRVVSDQGSDVGHDTLGELVGRSNFMMSGYHRRPDATRDAVWTDAAGRQFLRTGDLGTIDANGWVAIRGRSKDMIISGGLNVFPVDIEAVLSQHPSVRECCVLGVPDPEWGERPIACAVVAADTDLSEVKTWLNDRVAKHQRVIDVLAVDVLPRNTLGKVVKGELAHILDQHVSGSSRA